MNLIEERGERSVLLKPCSGDGKCRIGVKPKPHDANNDWTLDNMDEMHSGELERRGDAASSRCVFPSFPPAVNSISILMDKDVRAMSHVDGKNRRGIHVRAYSYSYRIHV